MSSHKREKQNHYGSINIQYMKVVATIDKMPQVQNGIVP